PEDELRLGSVRPADEGVSFVAGRSEGCRRDPGLTRAGHRLASPVRRRAADRGCTVPASGTLGPYRVRRPVSMLAVPEQPRHEEGAMTDPGPTPDQLRALAAAGIAAPSVH